MALVDYGSGIDPLRGKSLGTVFQTGQYGSVIKSKNSSQGQRLRPNLNAQEALSRSSKLFNTLGSSARTDWANAIPDFPTRDRYGNIVLSTARDLFMRTMARYPISQQFALSAPDSPYAGPSVSGGSLVWDESSLIYTPPTPPVGEPFSVSLFITRPLSSGQTQHAAYFRQIYFNPRFTSSSPVDLTAAYVSLFGIPPSNGNAIYREVIYKSQTPEILSDVEQQISLPPDIRIEFTLSATSGTPIRIPTLAGGVYNFTIDWGDSSSDTITTWNDPNTTHTYSSTAVYVVQIRGTFEGWRVADAGFRTALTDFRSFGQLKFRSGVQGFNGCSNVTFSNTDVPDTSSLNFMQIFFRGCSSMTHVPRLDEWDVSGVLSFLQCFDGCSSFNQDLPSWDVSSATNFGRIFFGCSSFNGNISPWNPISATSFSNSFISCVSFTGDLSGWNAPNNRSLRSTFQNCILFNSDVSGLVGPLVTDMISAFFNASSFNQPVTGWDTSGVTSMANCMRGCSSFDQSLATLDVSSCTSGQNFLLGSGVSNANYNATLIAWALLTLQSGVTWNFGNSQYTIGSPADTARSSIISTYSWTIQDGGGI